MKLIHSSNKLSEAIADFRLKGLSIGFVPTMGFLHQGHISLIRKAREENNKVVVSIFVNPMQFGPNEDFKKYPRDIKRDLTLIGTEGVDIVFQPAAASFYHKGFQSFVDIEVFGNVMCGLYRPGHFKGVCTVCTKLFNLVRPDRAYFGQKDYQQALIIKQIAADLNMGIKIKIMPIIREKDGLAMSSRNIYLNKKERQNALLIFKSLCLAKELIRSGERRTARIRKIIKNVFSKIDDIRIDYIVVADADNLKEEKSISSKKILVAIAAWIGNTRLIDNIIIKHGQGLRLS